jgi:hypothetical protein
MASGASKSRAAAASFHNELRLHAAVTVLVDRAKHPVCARLEIAHEEVRLAGKQRVVEPAHLSAAVENETMFELPGVLYANDVLAGREANSAS